MADKLIRRTDGVLQGIPGAEEGVWVPEAAAIVLINAGMAEEIVPVKDDLAAKASPAFKKEADLTKNDDDMAAAEPGSHDVGEIKRDRKK